MILWVNDVLFPGEQRVFLLLFLDFNDACLFNVDELN